jgi:hypothetical protein
MDASTLAKNLRERLTYDAAKGALYRKPGNGFADGQRVGSKDSSGKLQATFMGRRYRVDSLIWLLETGELANSAISHKNGDNADDRFSNLSVGTKQELAFLRRATKKFPFHDFSTTRYVNPETPVSVGCPQHGTFQRKPSRYISSELGCPTCARKAAAAKRGGALRKTPEERTETRRTYQRNNRAIYRNAVKRYNAKRAGCARFRAGRACRNMIARVVGASKLSKTSDTRALVGYSVEEFKDHIEKQFEPWMSWGNHGQWHVDHIFPVVRFLRMGVTDPKVINALTNLRPLSRQANLRKHDKLVA